MKPVIAVRKISKKYKIRESQSYLSLRDTIANLIQHPRSIFSNTKKGFWALRNVSFEVMPGEIVGVIGPNGAGKTTLLKIMSQITPPTSGEIILRGRVASLLEVGTGFHPELTGRENIYLSGAILGMRRSEIKKKFDEIVDFSEVEKFIDTPVKHYSSGMQVRLGFSVAAHLEADILLVDEILAVGDTEFQKKCLGKMDFARREGRTILFVSHNLSAVTSLCQRVVFLKKGRIAKDGKPEVVVTQYLRSGQGLMPEVKDLPKVSFTNDFAQLLKVRAHDQFGKTQPSFDIRKPIGIDVEYQIQKNNVQLVSNIQVRNSIGVLLFNSHEDGIGKQSIHEASFYKSTCWVPGNFLSEGIYSVRATLTTFHDNKTDEIDYPDAISFNVFDTGKPGAVKNPDKTDYPGLIRPKLKWERVKIKN